MDATEQILRNSRISVGVMGKADGEFILFPLDRPIDPTEFAAATERGFGYCGTLGVIDGRAVVEPGPQPEGARALLFAGLEFARSVADQLRPEVKGDASAWLEALYELPDARGGRDV